MLNPNNGQTLLMLNNTKPAMVSAKLDDELNRRAFFDTLPRFAKRPGALDVGRTERLAAFLKGRGLIDTVPPIGDYAIVVK